MIRRVLVAMLLATALAHADELTAYEADGDAPASAADARKMAVDDAFARAVSHAVDDLVAGDVRTANKQLIDKEIIGHARLWVAGFSVTKDDTDDGRRQLTLTAKVKMDVLRAKLEELKITTKDMAAAQAPPVGDQRAIAILLRVTTPKGMHATFGTAADHDIVGLAALSTVFHGAGMIVRRTGATGTPIDGDYAIADADAEPIADAAKADMIAIAGVGVTDPAPVRGQPEPQLLVNAHVKVIDRRTHSSIGHGEAIAAAPAGEQKLAVERALVAAANDTMPPQPAKLAQAAQFTGDDTPIADPGVVLVRLPAKTPFGMVQLEQKYLAGAKGVKAATLRRLSPAGWVIGVQTSDSIERVAAIAKKPPATDTSAVVKIVGDVVELALSGGI
ncbi:MAG: hypothetical protein QM831_01110 [Kofleriaceae bacterium]